MRSLSPFTGSGFSHSIILAQDLIVILAVMSLAGVYIKFFFKLQEKSEIHNK